MKKLEGKIAVITGGNSGIGLAAAKSFIDEGAKVIIFGRDAKTLARASETLGNQAFTVQGDVTSRDDLARLANTAKTGFGKVDILFVNAGVAEFQPLVEAQESHFDKLFNVNVKGAYFTVKALEPLLADGASVILTTSVGNEMGMLGTSVYSATKAAVRSFARTLSAELVGRGIRVNAVSPGPIATPIFGRMGLPEAAIPELEAGMIAQVPLGRVGQPSEIAKPVLFLASDDSSYVVGTELVADGGMTQI
jgi:NAD(P)-dependent dehydrogenase (short-subunit alcohol dehydrogenase family)